ncbi:MAG: hypothetical protein EU547_00780 [Promethearchaeota archaeon]|nr:MAG: hypothetical protein EU547_00780 [Candidatus Lokiarchaeota archaeon]
MNKKAILSLIIVIIISASTIITVFFLIQPHNTTSMSHHFFETVDDQIFYASSPSIDNEGNLYIGTGHKQRWQPEGNEWSEHYYLYSFFPNNTKRWEFKTYNSEMIKGDPAIHPDGLIMFVVESMSSINTNSFPIPNATYNKIYALNMDDGTLNWSSPHLVDDLYDGSWGSNGLHLAIDGDGYIYVQSQHNISSFYANGTLRWTDSKTLNYAGSPSIFKDTVYFPSGDTNNIYIYAYYTNGTFKWEYKETENNANNRVNMISFDDEGKIYAGTDNQTFYVINPEGSLNWTYTIQTPNAKVRGNVAIDMDKTVYFGTKNDQNSEFYALNSNGTLKWKYQGSLQDVYSSPTITDDGSIFFATEDHYVYRLDKETGNLRNRYELQDDAVWCSPTFDNDGTLYIGDMFGYFYAIEIGGIQLADTPWPCLGSSFNRSRCII